jgi:hypothetical protein
MPSRARFESNSEMFERAKEIALANLLAQAQNLVEGVVCSRHGGAPTLAIEGDSVTVSGCCLPFRKRIYEAIA